MSLKNCSIKKEYRSLRDDIVADFYIPLLSEANLYCRAVGFFSSTSLMEITYGISRLISNGGKIKLIASPKLSQEDIEAIERGYELREKVIEDALLRELYDVDDFYCEQRLNYISRLISDGTLDLKIATIIKNKSIGMYHEKIGIIEDLQGNKVAFTGSLNESITAIKYNYESIDVYCSWTSDLERVEIKKAAFDNLWNNLEESVDVKSFPEVEKVIINRYSSSYIDYDIDVTEYGEVYKKGNALEYGNFFVKPESVTFYNYQEDAINAWVSNSYRGIFDMATGTGKTITSLGAIEKLSQTLNDNLFVIIVCPYQHLVEQWIHDVNSFNVEPLICYSSYNWKKKFQNMVIDYNIDIIKNACIITTNATFSTERFQSIISTLNKNVCLVVDEAHNFGSRRLRECMIDNYDYRLGLSATIERHRDEEGTASLFEFFGDKCIEYTLERAIDEDKLTPYYYYPIPIVLEDDEYEEYMNLTSKIAKSGFVSDDNEISKSMELLLIKRARVIAGARQKLVMLKQIVMEKYKNSNQMLIYCGATNVNYSNYIEGVADDDEKRQIELVLHLLGNELNMRITKFTSEESSVQREQIKKKFSKGVMLQALAAIRCLDEGVNIPGIRTAFILASSTNPKEYIQRRGRVLRKAKNKKFATIYDFITLPRDFSKNSSEENNKYELSLLRKEIVRIEEFARLSENPSDSSKLKESIVENYRIY